MPWWLSLIFALGLPALKLLLRALEVKYPGITPFVEAVIKFLEGGGTVGELHSHCEQLPNFGPSELKRI